MNRPDLIGRRAFLASCPAGIGVAQLLRASCPPIPSDFLHLPKPDTLFKSKSVHFSIREKRQIQRPLLSELVNDPGQRDLKRLSHQLLTAYTKLASAGMKPQSLYSDVLTHHTMCHWDYIHMTWKFLPWHRGFLYLHERLIRTVLGPGNDDFRLPVWDWERSSDVPRPYLQWKSTPLASDAPPRKNRVDPAVDDCQIKAWMVTNQSNPREFIGYSYDDSLKSDAFLPKSQSGPHAGVHALLCGVMRSVDFAAADPLFFAHHTNIDRWWTVWDNKYGNVWRGDPNYDIWRGQKLYFFDHLADSSTKQPVYVCVDELLNLDSLGYSYPPSHTAIPDFQVMFPGTLTTMKKTMSDVSLGSLENKLNEIEAGMKNPFSAADTLENRLVRIVGESLVILHFEATLDIFLSSGYYLAGIRDYPLLDGDEKVVMLGGFGVFGSSSNEIVGDFCLSPAAFAKAVLLLHTQEGAHLIYQPFESQSQPGDPSTALVITGPVYKTLPFKSIRFEFRKLL